MTPRLTLNLGLRYELFTTIKEANDQADTFDFNSLSLIVPSGQNAQLTPTLASELSHPTQWLPRTHPSRPQQFRAPHWTGLSIDRQARPPQRLWHLLWRAGKRPVLQPKPGFQSSILFFGVITPRPVARPRAKSCGHRLLDLGREQLAAGAQLLSQGFPQCRYRLSPLGDPNTPNSIPSTRTWSRPTRSSGISVSSTNCPPITFSKFPTPALAD